MATQIPPNNAEFTLQDVCKATGGTLSGQGVETVRGVYTDSRSANTGGLFIALEGENFDAHDFLAQALLQGASVLLVKRGRSVPENAQTIAVDDTLVALGDLAAWHRTAWGKRVVGITGSVGKTTTKELVNAALNASGFRVHKTHGNLNNQIGVPMTLLALNSDHDVAVIEMGTSQRGEIARLAQIAKPDIAVLTAISASHTEGLGTVKEVADEKAGLFRAIGADGWVIGCGDDPYVASALDDSRTSQKIVFGSSPKNDVRLVQWEDTLSGTNCRFEITDRADALNVSLKLLGRGAALGAGAALCVVRALGKSPDRAALGLSKVPALWGRMRLLQTDNGATVVDDVYNANPSSMALSIEVASKLAHALSRRFIAVLGDMKELGALCMAEHKRVGQQLVSLEPTLFVGCGAEMAATEKIVRAAQLLSMHVDNSTDAAAALGDHVQMGDLILVKGSRSMEMERVVRSLCSAGASA